jgi:hypothetical protein
MQRAKKIVVKGDMMAVIEKSFDGYHVDFGYSRDGKEFLRSCWKPTIVATIPECAEIRAQEWVDGNV